MRRAGRVEPGKADARLSVLRHLLAVHVDAKTGAIQELDLAKALRELPDEERGWLTEKRTVQCQSCKAVSVFDPERVGQNCEFCGSPALVDYKEIKAPIRPQSLLPFKITQRRFASRSAAGTRANGWRPARSNVARSSIASTASTSRTGRSTRRRSVRGKRKPATTTTRRKPIATAGSPHPRRCGTPAGSRRQARSGIFSMTSRSQARRVSLSAPQAGRAISDTTELVPYQTAFLSGFVVEHYQVVLFDAADDRARR